MESFLSRIEVQSGFGRTGKMFACEHYGIEPDICVTANSLGGGLPLAAVTGRAEIMDAPGEGGLGGTFAGNPMACAAANAVLDTFEQADLLDRANSIGESFEKRARKWADRLAIIGDIRGLGAMRALELVKNSDTREPAPDKTKKIAQYRYEHGLITIIAGTYGNVIRLLVPHENWLRDPRACQFRACEGLVRLKYLEFPLLSSYPTISISLIDRCRFRSVDFPTAPNFVPTFAMEQALFGIARSFPSCALKGAGSSYSVFGCAIPNLNAFDQFSAWVRLGHPPMRRRHYECNPCRDHNTTSRSLGLAAIPFLLRNQHLGVAF